MTDNPKLIGNICRAFIAPVLVVLTGVLAFFGNDVKTPRGLLAVIGSSSITAVFCIVLLPMALNALNRLAVGRWRSQWVEMHIAEFCQILVQDKQDKDGIAKLAQLSPTEVSGQIARSVLLKFCSQKADFWLKPSKGA
jgi:hypothetical protein